MGVRSPRQQRQGVDVGAGGVATQMVFREAGLLSQVRLLAKPNESAGMTTATHTRGFNANRRCDGYAFTQQFYAANQPETTQLWGGALVSTRSERVVRLEAIAIAGEALAVLLSEDDAHISIALDRATSQDVIGVPAAAAILSRNLS